ncbi:probable cytochrome P450 313a4 [Culicoides brevitarsis]|uniref:probable cytochrome P450 313a4 n=1 Tax=Culicoides brevitarsis TaxID=469753 RepID=UPI00307B6ED6
MIVVISLAIIFLLFIINYELKRQQKLKLFKHIPGPKEYPIVGNLFSIRRDQCSDIEKLADVFNIAPMSKFIFFNQVYISISDPTIIQHVLTSPQFHKRPAILKFFEMENALFTTKYEIWKPLRKQLNPAFSQKSIHSMQPMMIEHITKFTEEIGSHVDKEAFDVSTLVGRFEVGQMFKTMLDCDFIPDDEFVNALAEGTDNVSKRASDPILFFDYFYERSEIGKKIRRSHNAANKVLRDFILPNFEERRKLAQQKESRSHMNLLDYLLVTKKDGRFLTYDEIEENIKSVFMAAIDTSTHTIAFTLLMLAMHPDIDRKVFEEISSVYQPGDALDADIVKKMTYLDMVVKEILRLFAIAPVTMRESLVDTHVDKVGSIPKGVTFFITMFKLNRNPLVWGPDANKFNPEHFNEENSAKRHIYNFVPFGGGTRGCIGMTFANLNIRMALAKVLVSYRFETLLKFENIKLKYGVSTKLNVPYLMKVFKR